MKKYLSLAAVLGAIAFLSVSYLAQAQQPAAGGAMAPAAAPAAPAAPAAAPTAPAAAPDAASAYTKDRAECDALASAPTTEGAAPSDADKAAALKKCLVGKGHSEDEITKAEAAKSAAPAAPTPAAP
jgi:hypothetical protein